MPRQNVAGVDLGPDGDLITIGKAKVLVSAVVAQDIAEQAKLIQASLDEVQKHLREYTDIQGRGTMGLLTTLEGSLLSRLNMLNAEFCAYESRTLGGRTRRAVNVVRGWLGLAALKPAWEVNPSAYAFPLASGVIAAGAGGDSPFMRPLGVPQSSPQLVRD